MGSNQQCDCTPAARMGHAQVLIGDKIVIFGGYDERQTYGDLWVFDTAAMTWLRPRTAGRPPSPRYNHTMELLPDGRILVFAGYNTVAKKGSEYLQDVRELDTETMVWSRPRVVGEFPEKRMQHRTCMMGRQMVMFGGGRESSKKTGAIRIRITKMETTELQNLAKVYCV